MKNLTNTKNILALTFLAFAVSFGFSFQISNLTSIYKFFGVHSENLSLLWLIPPLTGLVMQPIIGQMSDDTITKYGKRKPYIIFWAMLAAVLYGFFPFIHSLFWALFLIWLIDCSLNGNLESSRALTTDITKNSTERSKLFALQACASGIGATLGTALPYGINKIGLHKIHLIPGELPYYMKIAFIIISILLAIVTIFALFWIQEKPYKQELYKKKHKKTAWPIRTLHLFAGIFKNIKNAPETFKKICILNSVSWLGIFTLWLYFYLTIAQNFYGLPYLDVKLDHNIAKVLNKATLDSSFYFSIYNYVGMLLNLFLSFGSFNLHLKAQYLHASSLLIGGIAIALIGFESNAAELIISFIAIGIMWGAVSVLPYVIASQFLPKGKIGVYFGIFNMSITIPQILCGLFLSPIYIYLFNYHAGYLLLIAGLLLILSSYLWFKIPNLAKQSPANKMISAVSISPS